MKRSKMVDIMVDFYNTIPDNSSTYHEMDMILSKIQRLGMLPPSTYKTKVIVDGGSDWEGPVDIEVSKYYSEWDDE